MMILQRLEEECFASEDTELFQLTLEYGRANF
jgi:hypothetical protein